MSSRGWEGVTWPLQGPAGLQPPADAHPAPAYPSPSNSQSLGSAALSTARLLPCWGLLGKTFSKEPGGFIPTFPAPNTLVLSQLEHPEHGEQPWSQPSPPARGRALREPR